MPRCQPGPRRVSPAFSFATLRQWKDTYLGDFTSGAANNGGTEAVNGVIEMHRRIARATGTPTTTDSASASSRADYSFRICEKPL